MKKLIICTVFIFTLSLQGAFAGSELELKDAFQKALKRSETVALSAEEMALAQARFYRAFDYFLPKVHFEASQMWQDATGDAGASADVSNAQRRTVPESKFVFSQPLFSGFRELAALQSSGADKKRQWYAWKRAKEILFMNVMESFYTVLAAEKDAEVLTSTHELLAQRLKELEERVSLGKSRDSEMKTSFADLKLIESDLVDSRRQVAAAKNLLEFYLGEPLDDRALQEAEEEEFPAEGSAAEQAMKRFDVMSDEAAYRVAEKKIMLANGDLFPTIRLDGDYYTRRVGFQSGNDWDVTLTLDVPIFEIGDTLGDIKEAHANSEKARLQYSQTQRLAQLDIRNAVEELEALRVSEKALHDADRASTENYVSLSEEYRTNRANNLEVLDSLRRYQEVQRRYRAAYYAARKGYWKWRVAIGGVKVDS